MGHRTALITAGLIAAVIFAAAVAVGANLGILNAADSKPVGDLSASAPVKVVPASAARAVPQMYVIRKAGTVSVAAMGTGLRLVDVTVRHGWHWTLQQTADRRLRVTFRKGATVYRFLTVMTRHGRIVARVDHPVTRVVPYASAANAAPQPVAPVTSSVSQATTASQSTGPASAPAPASTSSHGDDHSGGGADD